MYVERADETSLWNFYASVEQLDQVNWDALFLVSKQNNIMEYLLDNYMYIVKYV